jgi:hypothetical protein
LIQQALNENWAAEEAILMPLMAENQTHAFTGYQFLAQRSSSPDTAIMEAETDLASAPPKIDTLNFHRFSNDWRIVIDETSVRNELKR